MGCSCFYFQRSAAAIEEQVRAGWVQEERLWTDWKEELGPPDTDSTTQKPLPVSVCVTEMQTHICNESKRINTGYANRQKFGGGGGGNHLLLLAYYQTEAVEEISTKVKYEPPPKVSIEILLLCVLQNLRPEGKIKSQLCCFYEAQRSSMTFCQNKQTKQREKRGEKEV